jgi:hypothetical protein
MRYALARNPLLSSQLGTHKAVPVTGNFKETDHSKQKCVFFVVYVGYKRSELRAEYRFTISYTLATFQLKSIIRLVVEIQFFNRECEMETNREL